MRVHFVSNDAPIDFTTEDTEGAENGHEEVRESAETDANASVDKVVGECRGSRAMARCLMLDESPQSPCVLLALCTLLHAYLAEDANLGVGVLLRYSRGFLEGDSKGQEAGVRKPICGTIQRVSAQRERGPRAKADGC